MPVARKLLVEPQVAVAPADPLPGLRDFVDHVRMQQRGPGLPVASLQAGDKALRDFLVATHPGNLPHRVVRHLTQLTGCHTVATVRLLRSEERRVGKEGRARGWREHVMW